MCMATPIITRFTLVDRLFAEPSVPIEPIRTHTRRGMEVLHMAIDVLPP